MGRIEPVERAKLGADVVVQHVGAEQPERRECAGPRRHDDAAHAELLGDRGGMHRAGAAERQQRKLAQIHAAPRREHPHLVGHAHVDDAADAGRRFGQCHFHRRGDLCFERGARRGGVELLRAAEKIIRIEQAADDVGVGHGRIVAAARQKYRRPKNGGLTSP